MIESKFGYGKGYTQGSNASNFNMSDASNTATIEIMGLFPHDLWPMHKDCFCVDCAGAIHEREKRFDSIKIAIENAMHIAFQEGQEFERNEHL